MKNNDIYKSVIIFSLLFFLLSCKNKKQEENLKSDSSGISIIETGELDAVSARAFVMSYNMYFYYDLRIIGLLEHGSLVNPGDSIIQFDPTELNKYIVNTETNLETQKANLEKMKVDQFNAINDLNTNYQSALSSFNLKKNTFEASVFEPERIRKIRELEFEQEKISLAREEKKIELRKIIMENDLKIQELRINQMKKQIQNVYDIRNSLTIRTEQRGVFQVGTNWRTGKMIRVGDNVYPGNTLAKVPELDHMKVNTFINENDFMKLYLGQKVAVRLDASPNIIFDGEVSYIGKLCKLKDHQNSRQKIFEVEVKMLKSDERLKPGMTVSCEFLNCK